MRRVWGKVHAEQRLCMLRSSQRHVNKPPSGTCQTSDDRLCLSAKCNYGGLGIHSDKHRRTERESALEAR